MTEPPRHWGKHRGTVANNVDPQQQGRIQVKVPDVLGDGQLSWAMPNVPYAGDQVGFFAVPPVGANVWVEFERGDPDLPIWAGCFWDVGELPVPGGLPTTKMFRTDVATVTVNDVPAPDYVTIEVDTVGATIAIGPTGLEITFAGASIALDPVRVSLNDGGLEVT